MSENKQQYVRNPAVRVTAAEIEMADYHFQEDEGEREPKYLLLPSGGKANRVMMCGTIMDVEDISNDENPFYRATVTDGVKDFYISAGQYNPEASRQLQTIDNDPEKPPAFVCVVGKTNEYRPEDDESEVFINIRPEQVSLIDGEQVDTWLAETVQHTMDRIEKQDDDYAVQAEERYGDRVELFKDELREYVESLE